MIEICVRSLENFENTKKQMEDKGFYVQEDFLLNDIYFIKKNKKINIEKIDDILSNILLVRETVGKRKMIVLKKKKINNKGEIINQKNIKCKIEDIDEGISIIEALGYKKLIEINDHNVLMTNGKNEIYIQDVLGLGVYLEMEQKNILLDNSNGNTIEELIDNFKQYNFKVDGSNYFTKKAYDMLKKQNFIEK